MKLTPINVDQTLSRLNGQMMPDDHPATGQLISLFGDHTFFLSENGLNIVEPAEPLVEGVPIGRVVKLAKWADENKTSLIPQEREFTDIVVEFSKAA